MLKPAHQGEVIVTGLKRERVDRGSRTTIVDAVGRNTAVAQGKRTRTGRDRLTGDFGSSDGRVRAGGKASGVQGRDYLSSESARTAHPHRLRPVGLVLRDGEVHQ